MLIFAQKIRAITWSCFFCDAVHQNQEFWGCRWHVRATNTPYFYVWEGKSTVLAQKIQQNLVEDLRLVNNNGMIRRWNHHLPGIGQ